jgi:GNAT superfamily N-acetyltransferase
MGKIFVLNVKADHPHLSKVIQFSIGYPTDDKILEVIASYKNADNILRGAYLDECLIGIIGIQQIERNITIRHISVLPEFRGLRVGTLLLNNIKVQLSRYRINAETDEESVGFYLKSGFTCTPFQGKYGNLRFSCKFNNDII